MTETVIDRLRSECADMQALIARADTKAQGMAGVYSLLLAAAAFTRGQVPPSATTVLLYAAVLVGAALALALLVILPRLGMNPGTGLMAWSSWSVEQIMSGIEQETETDAAARQLRKLACIAVAKFRLLQAGVVLVLLALLLVGVAAVITAATP
ncbi:Pycsar system effector family protein [Saccharopolyspora sp. NPDC002376]